jgi:hypothetical protein
MVPRKVCENPDELTKNISLENGLDEVLNFNGMPN